MEVTWSSATIAMAVRSDHSCELFSMKPEELEMSANGTSKGSVSQGAQFDFLFFFLYFCLEFT